MEYKRITSIDDLNKAIKEKHHNFTLLLAGGLLHSRKRISFADKTKSAYKITNHFDGTWAYRQWCRDSRCQVLLPLPACRNSG